MPEIAEKMTVADAVSVLERTAGIVRSASDWADWDRANKDATLAALEHLKRASHTGMREHEGPLSPEIHALMGKVLYPMLGDEAKEAYGYACLSAHAGCADGQYLLGRMYRDGINGLIINNNRQAAKCFEEAALQGHVDAQYDLAGIHVSRGNYEKATDWYEKALENGSDSARQSLVGLYERLSRQIQNDLADTFNRLTEALEQKHALTRRIFDLLKPKPGNVSAPALEPAATAG